MENKLGWTRKQSNYSLSFTTGLWSLSPFDCPFFSFRSGLYGLTLNLPIWNQLLVSKSSGLLDCVFLLPSYPVVECREVDLSGRGSVTNPLWGCTVRWALKTDAVLAHPGRPGKSFLNAKPSEGPSALKDCGIKQQTWRHLSYKEEMENTHTRAELIQDGI